MSEEQSYKEGLSLGVVLAGGLVFILLAGCFLFYVGQHFATQANETAKITQSNAPKSEAQAQNSQPANGKEAKEVTTETKPAASPKTLDIGAYLTYGGQASSLTRASAKISPDRRRLLVGLFEESQSAKEKPALAVIFELKDPTKGCNVNNIKEFALLFNLKAMGDIAAQQVELVKNSPDEIQQGIEKFTCDLKPGGTVNLHLVGADLNAIKPKGSTFGWGVRLAQEIG